MSTTVNREVWQEIIEDNLFTDWKKVAGIAKNDNVYVDSKSVHIPNAGAPATLLKNNSSYPVAAEERSDTVKSYDIDSFQMPPIRLGRFDIKDLTYDKMKSIVSDQIGAIGERIKYEAYINWYIGKVTGKHVVTTGSDTETSGAPSSTATVKYITIDDVKKAKAILDKQKIKQEGRILLLPVEMFHQLHSKLVDNFTIIENDGFSMLDKKFMGFDVVMDVEVVNVTSAGTARAYGHTGASTDLQVGLAYQKDAVSLAMKDTIYTDVIKGSGMYGETVEAECWAGSAYRREDKYGVVPIIQAT